MGLLDLIWKLLTGGDKLQCPSCGTAGAKRTKDERFLCRNPVCPNFDPSLAPARRLHALTTIPAYGSFQPDSPVSVKYRNFLGEERSFVVEESSLERRNNHVVAQAAPTGRKITLSRERILNLSEVESVMSKRVDPGQDWPSPRERQILNYHKKHGSTSRRFEEVRRRYPNW